MATRQLENKEVVGRQMGWGFSGLCVWPPPRAHRNRVPTIIRILSLICNPAQPARRIHDTQLVLPSPDLSTVAIFFSFLNPGCIYPPQVTLCLFYMALTGVRTNTTLCSILRESDVYPLSQRWFQSNIDQNIWTVSGWPAREQAH